MRHKRLDARNYMQDIIHCKELIYKRDQLQYIYPKQRDYTRKYSDVKNQTFQISQIRHRSDIILYTRNCKVDRSDTREIRQPENKATDNNLKWLMSVYTLYMYVCL